MKTNNNNVTRTQSISFTAAWLIAILFFDSLHWQPERLICSDHTFPSAVSKQRVKPTALLDPDSE